MVTISERAAGKIKDILKQENKEGWALRIGVKSGGCSGFKYIMRFDNQQSENDQVLNFHDVDIYIDSKSFAYLSGSQIDYTEGLNGSGFVFNNPNIRKSCHCGDSFAV